MSAFVSASVLPSPSPSPSPSPPPATDAQARACAARAAACWQRGDAAALASLCVPLSAAELQRWPDLARWRGLLGLLREDEEALACLALAHAGHLAAGQAGDALLDACIALALCLCDIGSMEGVNAWLERAAALPGAPAPEDPSRGAPAPEDPSLGALAPEDPSSGALAPGEPSPGAPAPADSSPWALWWHLGQVARAVLQPPDDGRARDDRASLAWLHRLWQPLAPPWPAHEQLLVASVLVNAQFSRQQYEQFDLLAGTVGTPAVLGQVADLPAARWHYTLGFAYYQVGRFDAAQRAWQAGLQRAATLPQIGTMLGLASLRLLIDQGRLADAQRLQAGLATAWGPGRPSQRVELAQMRARLLLLQGQPSAADAALGEALALAHQAGFSATELASCRTDQAQLWLALGRVQEAQALLQQQAQVLAGRDAAIFRCLGLLVQALQAAAEAPAQAVELAAPAAGKPTAAAAPTATPTAAATAAPPAVSNAVPKVALHAAPAATPTATPTAAHTPLAQGLALASQLRYTMFFRLLPAWAARVCALALRRGVEPAFAAEVVRQRALPAPPLASHHWPWPLWLRLLGGFELRLHGQAQPRQPKPQAKPLELLRLLACSPGMGLGMAQAADALWPDADGAAAQKSLEVTVHRLRKLLGDAQLLTQSEGHLQLDVQRVSSDLRLRDGLTQQLVDEALAPRGDAAGANAVSERLRDWLALGAPGALLLPGAPESPWLLERRQQVQRDVRRTHSAVAALLARARAQAGDGAGAGAADAALLATLESTVAQVFAAGPG